MVNSDAFRGGLALAESIRDAWPWFVLGGCCLFLGDVMVRRIAFDFAWVGKTLDRLRGEKEATEVVTRLDALRKNKEQLDGELEKRRASVRFEPTRLETDATDDAVDLADLGDTKSAPTMSSRPKSRKRKATPNGCSMRKSGREKTSTSTSRGSRFASVSLPDADAFLPWRDSVERSS